MSISSGDPLALLNGITSGQRRALARAISFCENSPDESRPLISALYRSKRLGRSKVVGITGSPGVGKSTLTGFLIRHLRTRGYSVGVILIDPSSPFTGGALLGDRIRMSESNTDTGVFIRSMGSRGHLGGLSLATQDTVSLLDAFGFDYILIETVGIGQAETEIVKTADLTVVVAVPGLGDEIQIIKAGVMEIGDIFVVNKADKDGAEKVITEINMMLDMAPGVPGKDLPRPPVLRCIANRDQGVSELLTAVDERWLQLDISDILLVRRRERIWQAVNESLHYSLMLNLRPYLSVPSRHSLVERIRLGESSPFEEAQGLLHQKFF
ncbi:MAG: methylmalonyl Co-A mutase-associated GTPase MeaB [Symbiobacteriaceae bacterium]|nr:methylmalonyl Co-A mutase-associated GTPase MeaB [Symbiobacteriaceae bacterium]